jgi:hypothetical protein
MPAHADILHPGVMGQWIGQGERQPALVEHKNIMNRIQQLIDRIFFAGEIARLADDNLRLIAQVEADRAERKACAGLSQPKGHKAKLRMAEIAITETAAGVYEWQAFIGSRLIDRGQRTDAGDAERDATSAIMSHIAGHGGSNR